MQKMTNVKMTMTADRVWYQTYKSSPQYVIPLKHNSNSEAQFQQANYNSNRFYLMKMTLQPQIQPRTIKVNNPSKFSRISKGVKASKKQLKQLNRMICLNLNFYILQTLNSWYSDKVCRVYTKLRGLLLLIWPSIFSSWLFALSQHA